MIEIEIEKISYYTVRGPYRFSTHTEKEEDNYLSSERGKFRGVLRELKLCGVVSLPFFRESHPLLHHRQLVHLQL